MHLQKLNFKQRASKINKIILNNTLNNEHKNSLPIKYGRESICYLLFDQLQAIFIKIQKNQRNTFILKVVTWTYRKLNRADDELK